MQTGKQLRLNQTITDVTRPVVTVLVVTVPVWPAVHWSQGGQQNHLRPVTTGLELNLWSCLYVINKSINVIYYIGSIYIIAQGEHGPCAPVCSPDMFHLLVFIYMFGLVVLVDWHLSCWSMTTMLPLISVATTCCKECHIGPQVSFFTSFRQWPTFFCPVFRFHYCNVVIMYVQQTSLSTCPQPHKPLLVGWIMCATCQWWWNNNNNNGNNEWQQQCTMINDNDNDPWVSTMMTDNDWQCGLMRIKNEDQQLVF